jgi:tRNA-2-methylthio-N6-dimethylallyladenosine synthase
MPQTPNFNSHNVKPLVYTIQTNGCQMNVADSERLEGILQHQLHMTKAITSRGKDQEENEDALSSKADLVIINTCSIRDSAQQKLYHLLGPYRQRKRAGHSLAIGIMGCVAQQEGKELLQSFPEVDVVVGPQYIPYIGNILEQLQWNHQMVVTAPMLIADQYHPTNTVVKAATMEMQDHF